MTRLQDPDPNDVPEDVARFLADFPPDPMFKMLTHSPSTVRPFIGLAQALYTSLELPVRERELAILTVAEGVRCDFVFTQHVPLSRNAGVDDATRELIKNGDHTHPALSKHDRAVIQLAAEVVAGPRVSDEVFAAAGEFLSARELVELLHVCGYYWTFCRLCTALDVQLTQMYAQLQGADGWTGES
ncbi:carboxymuconolactone decarboxylase family protein [Streptomyces prunicolor]|uniref:carboxymuconolactone decarboxylase family protein n=1 Tax=Streptomyces prunicolor TaxID=67348 RepID=UPI0033CEF31B